MEELDLKELLTMFWNKKMQVALITTIFIVMGLIYTLAFVTPKYSSSTTLLLATSNTSSTTNSITTTDITLNSKLVSTYSVLVKSKDVIRTVISNLGIDVEENELRKNITVSSVSDTEVIEITVTDKNASNAAKIANEIAKVFTEKVSGIYNINNVHIVDKAEVNDVPSNVNHLKDLIIFTFIGLVISVMYVLLENMLDTTVKTAEDIEKQFGLPVLASIPMCIPENQKGGRK